MKKCSAPATSPPAATTISAATSCPSMFKKHENSTHDDILFAPHKTPNFDIPQVRMKRGDQDEILIEHFKPSPYLLAALGVE